MLFLHTGNKHDGQEGMSLQCFGAAFSLCIDKLLSVLGHTLLNPAADCWLRTALTAVWSLKELLCLRVGVFALSMFVLRVTAPVTKPERDSERNQQDAVVIRCFAASCPVSFRTGSAVSSSPTCAHTSLPCGAYLCQVCSVFPVRVERNLGQGPS